MFIPPSATSDWENRPYDGPRVNPDYADFGEAFDRSFADTWFRERSTSEARNLDDAYKSQAEEIFKQTGERIDPPITGLFRDVDNPANKEAYDNKINALNEQHGTNFKTIAAIKAGIAIEAHARREKSETKTPIGAAWWGDLAGGAWAAMHDPAQHAGLLLSFGSGASGAATTLMGAVKSVGKVALMEGVAGAAVQTAIEPQVSAYHNQSLQMERSLQDSGEAVLQAGIGGAVFGGGLHGIGLGFRGIVNKFKKEVGQPRTTAEADALQVAETRAAIEDINPLPQEALPAHVGAVKKASQDIVEGRPVEVGHIIKDEMEALGQAYDQVKTHPQGPANDPLVAIKPEDIEGAIHIARGGWKGTGDLEVKGSGFGLVKFIFKHGEGSKKPPEVQLTKSDLLEFPRIVREYETSREAAGDGSRGREWRVEVVDPEHGKRTVVFAENIMPKRGNKNYLVSAYIDQLTPGENLSLRKTGGSESSSGVGSLLQDTAPDLSLRPRTGQKPPEFGPDQAFKTSGQDQSPKDQGHSSGPLEPTIAPKAEKGKVLPSPSMLRPPAKKPRSLSWWMAAMGGLKEEGGELAAMGIVRKAKGGPVGLL